ncbi:MAG: uberolysin/carnocyclin family circular bacteriocin [Anoxybacillus sp.]|nr:uberolysin/carnocyclin family circular bacteriocin [Anoxybacillus sp.]MCL6586999.1 uberolysin/carnocyclin family circular bacteriocin [Anoxybacillus sp.]
MSLLALVAGTLGVSQAVATTVVSIVLTGSTLVSIILGITAILSGGVDAILEIGWSTFVATVKKIVTERGKVAAIAW